MNRRPYWFSAEPRPGTLEGKLKLLAELAGAPGERAVPLLLELMCDQSWHIRERAVEALVKRGGDQVIEPVKALLAEGLWYTRSCAADALGQLGDLRGVDALAARLADENPSVRKSVSRALAVIAARKGAKPVKEALERAGVSSDLSRLGRLGAAELELARALVETKPPKDSHRH
jgi:HEAT repeat protein